MQNIKYPIIIFLSVVVFCSQAHAMKRIFNPRTLRHFMARQYASSAHMDINQAFRVLGFSSAVSLNDVRKKYHELLKAHHPDRNGNSTASTEKIKEINQAYKLAKEYLENGLQNFSAQQGSQQQSSRGSYHQSTNNTGYNTHNYQQYGQARSNHSSNSRQQYEQGWSSSESDENLVLESLKGIAITAMIFGTWGYFGEKGLREDAARKAANEAHQLRLFKKTLHGAIEYRNKSRVKGLIGAGANFFQTDKKNRTPLYAAVQQRDIEIIEMLLDAGAEVNYAPNWSQKYNVNSPLEAAVDMKNKRVVELLLKRGATPSTAGRRKGALLRAIGKKDKVIVKMLLDAGANIEAKPDLGPSYTPLAYAAKKGFAEIVQMLIDEGAQVNACGKERFTALDIAAQNGRKGVVKILRAAGGKFMSELG